MAILAQSFYDDEEKDLVEDKKKKQASEFVGEGVASEGVGVGEETQPGQFTGIEQYLEENKPETQEMVSDIQTGVQEQQDKFKQSLEDAGQKFRSEVQSGGVSFDQGLAKEFEETPFQAMQDKEKLERFKAMRDAQYKGPKQLAERQDLFQPLVQQQQALQSRAQQLQQDPGSLVQQRAQRPITEGQRALNRALVSGTPGAVQSLREQSREAQDVSTRLEQQRKALRELATQRAQETRATAERIGEGLQTQRQSIKDRISERIKKLRGEAATSQTEFREALAREYNPESMTYDQGELDAIERSGLTMDQFNRLRGLESYIDNPYQDIAYRDINIQPQMMSSDGTFEAGLQGTRLQGRVRYVGGKPVLDDIPQQFRAQVMAELNRQEQEDARFTREGRGLVTGPSMFRQEVEGRDFDPSVVFNLANPENVYREGTVTTEDEYKDLQALRDLQQIQSPMNYELEETPDLYSIVPQVSGAENIDEILEGLQSEREMYEQEALNQFIKENPFVAQTFSRRRKPRKSGPSITPNRITSWSQVTPVRPGR